MKLHLTKLKEIIRFTKFNPDGCTFAPDFNFTDCCNLHDYFYRAKLHTRKEADNRLFNCILNEEYSIWIAYFYWLGVRIFGWPIWKLKNKKTYKEVPHEE